MTAAKGKPKFEYKKTNDEDLPKKYTVMLHPKDLKMLDELCEKYATNKSNLLRKGIEVLYMNANNAVYWQSTVELHTQGNNNGTEHKQNEQNLINCS